MENKEEFFEKIFNAENEYTSRPQTTVREIMAYISGSMDTLRALGLDIEYVCWCNKVVSETDKKVKKDEKRRE